MFFAPLFLLPALTVAIPVENSPVRLRGLSAFKPGDITIKDASASGNGCPQSTFSTTISDDREYVTFGFDKFQAYIGPSAAQSDKTKQCQIHLSLNYPQGLHFTVLESTYHGWARLDPGVTGSFVSSYYFSQDASHTAQTRVSIVGDAHWQQGDTYQKDDLVQSTSAIYSPCGANGILNVNNRIALSVAANAPNATGELSDDDATVGFKQQLNLQWACCGTSCPATGSTGGDFTIGAGSTSLTEG